MTAGLEVRAGRHPQQLIALPSSQGPLAWGPSSGIRGWSRRNWRTQQKGKGWPDWRPERGDGSRGIGVGTKVGRVGLVGVGALLSLSPHSGAPVPPPGHVRATRAGWGVTPGAHKVHGTRSPRKKLLFSRPHEQGHWESRPGGSQQCRLTVGTIPLAARPHCPSLSPFSGTPTC